MARPKETVERSLELIGKVMKGLHPECVELMLKTLEKLADVGKAAGWSTKQLIAAGAGGLSILGGVTWSLMILFTVLSGGTLAPLLLVAAGLLALLGVAADKLAEISDAIDKLDQANDALEECIS